SYDSMDNFLLRYWLGSMGINPDKEVKIQEIPPSQLIFKLEAGLIDGYSVSEPWNQTAVLQQAGFTTYLNRDIWRGYPSKVLAAMNVWTTTNPNTARAVVAALLTAAKFIDTPENATLVGEILAQAKYLNTDRQNLEPSLNKNYNYGNLDGKPRLKTVDDLSIFSGRNITYLQPYQANYPWHSCAAWLLTQLIRWDRLTIRQYPENAPQLLGQIYPLSIYKDVAKALKIDIPNDSFKVEPAEAFIDSRSFDPQAAVAYLNSFTVRS
ncbi:MAG: nitrate ABC transporter substrate-binding protein, partial [Cyanobacteria bacterium J083]